MRGKGKGTAQDRPQTENKGQTGGQHQRQTELRRKFSRTGQHS